MAQSLRDRWRPPRTLKITRSGKVFLVVTVGVGIAALNTGNNLLFLVLAVCLSTIVMSGVLSERCLRDIEVRRLGPVEAFANEPFALRWAVRSPKTHAFALTVTEVSDEVLATCGVPIVLRGEEQVVRATATARRRGPHALSAIRITTTYPFGLFAKSRLEPAEATLVVYPARRGQAMTMDNDLHTPDGETGSPLRTGGTGDIAQLSELHDGEPARHIHWKKSAALGQWVRLNRERDDRQTFILEVAESLRGREADPECERLAATARALLAQGHEVGLRTGRAELRPATGAAQERQVLRALAWVGYPRPGGSL